MLYLTNQNKNSQNKIIRYTHPPPSLGKLSSSAHVLTHAHTRLMTGIIFIKTDRAERKNEGLYLFSGVNIIYSCCCICYQSSVSLDVLDELIFALVFCSLFSCSLKTVQWLSNNIACFFLQSFPTSLYQILKYFHPIRQTKHNKATYYSIIKSY